MEYHSTLLHHYSVTNRLIHIPILQSLVEKEGLLGLLGLLGAGLIAAPYYHLY